MLKARQDPQSGEGRHGQDQGNVVAAETHGGPDRTRNPQARCRRSSFYRLFVSKNCTAADEAHACDQPLDDPRHGLGLPNGEMLCRLHKSARSDRDQRKGSQSRASLLMLAVPADRQSEHIGDDQRGEMWNDVEIPRSEQFLDHDSPSLKTA